MIFQRTELLLGKENFQKLQKKSVAVFGLGGVGSFAAEALIRSGIEDLLLIDFDVITESNLNRLLISNQDNIGKYKTEIMKERLEKINPKANIRVYTDFYNKDVRKELLKNIDFVVDAIDSVGPKVGLLNYCYKNNLKVISVLGSAGRLDPSKVDLKDISKTYQCSLARRVRKNLKSKYGIKKGIPAVFSSEVAKKQHKNQEFSAKEYINNQGENLSTLSSIAFIPSIMGMWAASYVVRNICFDFEI